MVQDVWTGSGSLQYVLTGLSDSTQYDVQVRAVNTVGDGSWSATATGSPTEEQSPPGSPANAQYRREGATTIVTWDPSAGVTHYKVYHSDSRFPRCSLLSSGRLSGCEELAANLTGASYTHATPDDDTNHYWVVSCNDAGCSGIDSGNPAQFVDNRPAAPANAQYRREGTTAVVSWGASAGADYYKVYHDDFFGTNCRLGSSSPSFCELLDGNVAGTTYTHATPDEDRNYYWVVACNSAGCSDIDSGNPATLVETTPSISAPGAPTGLTATANGETRIDLSWTAPSDNGGADITGYRIEVSPDGSNWSDLVADTGSTSTSYSHTGLSAGSTRHYRASAINSEGTGPASNTRSATTDAATAPDLVVDTPTVSDSSPTAGESFTLNATVRNQGNGPSGSTTLSYYRSSDSAITSSDTSVGTDPVSGLSASGTSPESTSLTAPSTPGAYYYGACVDAVSDESDTTNNCSDAVTVTVGAAPAPDLVVDRPTVSESSPTAGASFTLSATVRNQGNGSSGSTTLRYYRSTDSTITASDTAVGTDPVGGLPASGTSPESTSLTAPSTPGAYYYGACVDSVSGESDTANNCSPAVTVTVVAAVADSIDYDSNSNGLIEISNLEQLNAIRWDLNGDGVVDESANISTYTAAFPNAAENMGCSSSGCMGYELTRDLDFNSAASYASGSVNENWRTSTGWEPIGGLRALNSGFQTSFNTEFDGNGHTISNLYIDYSGQSDDNYLGLFGRTRSESVIHDIGLVAVECVGGVEHRWSRRGQ